MRTFLLLILALGGTELSLLAQSPEPETSAAAGQATESFAAEANENRDAAQTVSDEQELPAEDKLERKLQQRKIEIGLILTSGIVVLGIFLVVVTLIYGRRMRRQLSSGRGSSAARDDLWYLKRSVDSSSSDDSRTEPEGETQ